MHEPASITKIFPSAYLRAPTKAANLSTPKDAGVLYVVLIGIGVSTEKTDIKLKLALRSSIKFSWPATLLINIYSTLLNVRKLNASS